MVKIIILCACSCNGSIAGRITRKRSGFLLRCIRKFLGRKGPPITTNNTNSRTRRTKYHNIRGGDRISTKIDCPKTLFFFCFMITARCEMHLVWIKAVFCSCFVKYVDFYVIFWKIWQTWLRKSKKKNSPKTRVFLISFGIGKRWNAVGLGRNRISFVKYTDFYVLCLKMYWFVLYFWSKAKEKKTASFPWCVPWCVWTSKWILIWLVTSSV